MVLKNLAFVERCPLLEGNFKKIITFVRYSWHVSYLGCPLMRGFTAFWGPTLKSAIFYDFMPKNAVFLC